MTQPEFAAVLSERLEGAFKGSYNESQVAWLFRTLKHLTLDEFASLCDDVVRREVQAGRQTIPAPAIFSEMRRTKTEGDVVFNNTSCGLCGSQGIRYYILRHKGRYYSAGARCGCSNASRYGNLVPSVRRAEQDERFVQWVGTHEIPGKLIEKLMDEEAESEVEDDVAIPF